MTDQEMIAELREALADAATDRDKAETERAQLLLMVESFVACMVPHPVEHPSMHRAWTRGKALLAELRPETAIAEEKKR